MELFWKSYDQKLYFSSWFWNPISLKVVPFDRAWNFDLIYDPIEFLERWFLINFTVEQKCEGQGKISLHSKATAPLKVRLPYFVPNLTVTLYIFTYCWNSLSNTTMNLMNGTYIQHFFKTVRMVVFSAKSIKNFHPKNHLKDAKPP